MQNILWKVILIVAVLGLCVYSMYPPSQKIRLGKDLRGGTSLVYLVNMPDGTPDKARVLTQTIDVLKERVNPQGILDISMQPLGVDRIEIVMPLPNDQVKALKVALDDAIESLQSQAQITESDLDDALRFDRAPTQFGGDDPDRASKIKDLQDAYNALQESRQALTEARAAAATQPATPPAVPAATQAETQPATQPATQTDSKAQIALLERRVVDAMDRYEPLRAEVLSQNLNEVRVLRAVALSKEPQQQRDATDKPMVDDKGDKVMGKSPRDEAIDALKTQFPQLTSKIDAVIAAYDKYQAQRTTLDDPEDLMRLLRGAGVLEFHIVVSNSAPEVNVQELRDQLAAVGPDKIDSTQAGWFPINDIKQWADEPPLQAQLEADPQAYFASRYDMVADRYNGQPFVLLYTGPGKAMTHTADQVWTVQSTGLTVDRLGRDAVQFQLDASGGTYMARLTGAHVNQKMAIVLDGQVYSAPNLMSQIGNSGVIEGDFSRGDIDYLTRVLAAGALSARLSDQPILVNTLGPSIGADNLARGMKAFMLSIIVTSAFMLIYYFFAGVIANIALLCNAIVIFGVMAMIDGTFTLPGLAGIALAIAMAVDANVLIYERIREELVNNHEDLKTAIRLGYSRAMSAIIDGNVAHLITCVVLLKTATTEVKGFALTMILGVFATLFTALFVTRVLFTFYTAFFHAKRLPMLATVFPAIHQALTPSIDWIGKRRVFYAFGIIATLVALGLVASLGSSILDTEFRGGVALTMQTRLALPGEPADREGRLLLSRPDVEAEIHALGDSAGPDAPAVHELRSATVLTVGEPTADYKSSRFQVKVSNPPTAAEDAANDAVQIAIAKAFSDRLDVTPPLEFADRGGPHVGKTFPIEEAALGANIGMPEITRSVRPYIGGVAIVIKNITPPITVQQAKDRIERLRQQPDFADARGRDVDVVELEPVNPADPLKGSKSFAVLVYDADLDSNKVDISLWDEQLARAEWTLVSTALATGSSFQEVASFSSAIARTLAANATVAVVLSLIGMLIYIWVRFGSLRYSVATVVAVAHNVMICLGAIALTHYLSGTRIASWLMLQDFRIDLNVIAALLTIIGYSLNDTIVILDRIRENRGKRLFATPKIVNDSVNQTFSRTIITGGSTIMASIILYVLGGTGIQPFAFCFLVGLIVGTYSSVAIAAPLVVSRAEVEAEARPPAPPPPPVSLVARPRAAATS